MCHVLELDFSEQAKRKIRQGRKTVNSYVHYVHVLKNLIP